MSKPDENEIAARVVREATSKHEQPLPANVEAAWEAWSRGSLAINKFDLV